MFACSCQWIRCSKPWWITHKWWFCSQVHLLWYLCPEVNVLHRSKKEVCNTWLQECWLAKLCSEVAWLQTKRCEWKHYFHALWLVLLTRGMFSCSLVAWSSQFISVICMCSVAVICCRAKMIIHTLRQHQYRPPVSQLNRCHSGRL